MKILAIVITYYPDEQQLKDNISAFIDYVDQIIIWENTPINDREKYRYVSNSKVLLFGDEQNSIPHALNFAWKYAVDNNFDYLMTMDQDSEWINFDSFLCSTIYNKSCPFGIWGPNINTATDDLQYDDVRYLINSGMLQAVSIINMVGGWHEGFCIDAFDIDYCYHARALGVHSYRVCSCKLLHTYGSPSIKSIFGRELRLLNYPPSRLYGIYRNHIILIRKYKNTKQLKKRFIKYWLWDNVWAVMFGERNKQEKIHAIIKGIFAGLFCKIK